MFKSLDGTKKVFKNYVKKIILKVKNASLKKMVIKRLQLALQKTSHNPVLLRVMGVRI